MEPRFGIKDLPPSFTYVRNGKEVTTKMTMGLLQTLLQAVGNYQNVSLVGLDPLFNDLVLRKFMTERDVKGRPVPIERDGVMIKGREAELEDLNEIEVSLDDMEGVLFFCQIHMLDFTVRALNRAGVLNKQTLDAQATLSNLVTGLNGSLNSASQKQFASASVSSNPT